MIHHLYTIGLRIDLDQLITQDSELNEFDPNESTTIDRIADDGYPYFEQKYFALYSLFHTRARFIFTPVPPRRQIQRPLAETDKPSYTSLDEVYAKVHRFEEFPDPLGPVGDPTTKHIRPPPTQTSGLQPSRFSEPCFALSMLRRGNALDIQIVTNDQTEKFQKDEPDAELEEDFEESQYGLSADSDNRKPKYQLIKEKDVEIIGRGQGGEKYDCQMDCQGYDVCEEDETLFKIDVEILYEKYKEFIKRKKERAALLRQAYEQKVYSQHRLLHPIPIPPIIVRATGIPGTQEIVPIPPLWSAKVDPQREKDIYIELPPAPALFVVNSCNYTAATLAGFGLKSYIEEVPGVVLNIDLEKRKIIFADGLIIPYELIIITAGQQDQTLKRLSQPIAENDFHVDVIDGAITMNDEPDAI
ncbi:MAG: hypothetical protein EZS28_004085 [Streblomastix strix]|uniref:Uncharacterized protein n=1 Tax=Streblomastix strix TaxID=222440 RepID=A0A5J4X0W4_9EUKA|nr:MAG: hypothetical protein EZS28_004085 [Streblomastix strix]